MKVGILGGGQLARMLIEDGLRMGLDLRVLCGSGNEPAAQVCPRARVGRLDSTDDLKAFTGDLDLVTVESEFVDTNLVERALGSADFQPGLFLLEQLQDRWTQKQLLTKFLIPTSPFVSWNAEIPAVRLFDHFPKGFVLKKRRFGYDGYGTFVFHDESKPEVQRDSHGYIAEEFVPFKRELAFSLARNAKSEFAVFPLVETKQVDSRCLWVKGPVKHAGFRKLLNRFKKMMNEVDYRGILAAEIFETKKGLLVNELAPRVHNSAHYSQDALSFSQFEAHLRGILDWPLENPVPLTKGFAMVNLLGETTGAPVQISLEPLGKFHWYGKKDNRAGRKMGHLNVVGKSPDEALKRALKWRKGFQL